LNQAQNNNFKITQIPPVPLAVHKEHKKSLKKNSFAVGISKEKHFSEWKCHDGNTGFTRTMPGTPFC
jgi:hypothetical protein